MRGMFASCTGSSVSRQAARIGRAPFLLPDARSLPLSGRPPSITNDSATGLAIVEDTGVSMLAPHVEEPCRRLGHADAVYEERGSSTPRAGRRGVDRVVRVPVRR